MMATGGGALRPRPVRHGGLPRLAAPGRPDDRGRPRQPEDGARCSARSTTRCPSPSGSSRWACAPSSAGCSTTTRSSRASTTSCPSTCTCPGCPPRPEMLIDAILKLHDQIQRHQARHEPRARGRRARGRRADRHPDARDEGAAAVSDDSGRRACRERRQRGVALVPAGATALEVVAVRHGMFGVTAAATRRATAGWSAAVALPGATPRPYGGCVRRGRRRPRRGCSPTTPTRSRRSSSTAASSPSTCAASTCSAFMQALRDDADAALRDVPRRQRRALPATRPGASCTPSTPCCRSRTTGGVRVEVSVPGRRPAPSRRSCRSTRPTTGTSARRTTSSGIVFDGHPALTRIQMPDDWPGHPQRKDYPLGGIPVEYKGAEIPPPDAAEGVLLMTDQRRVRGHRQRLRPSRR